jgi:hypothetical protein
MLISEIEKFLTSRINRENVSRLIEAIVPARYSGPVSSWDSRRDHQ